MELQKIFDDTVRHLHRQGKAAKRTVVSQSSGHSMTACAYRGMENTKCAVGYWIPDDRYSEIIEGEGLGPTAGKLTSPIRRLPPELQTQDAVDLLRGLQVAHDNAYIAAETLVWVNVWDAGGIALRLLNIGHSQGLNTDVVEECWPR